MCGLLEEGFFQGVAFFFRQASSQTLQLSEVFGFVDVVGFGGDGHIDAPDAFSSDFVLSEVSCHGECCGALRFENCLKLIVHVAVDVDSPRAFFTSDFGGCSEREDSEVVFVPAELAYGFGDGEHDGVDGVESSV